MHSNEMTHLVRQSLCAGSTTGTTGTPDSLRQCHSSSEEFNSNDEIADKELQRSRIEDHLIIFWDSENEFMYTPEAMD